jgi:hypothetical protein
VVLDQHVPHHVVAVRAMIPAVALGDREDRFVGLRVPLVTPIPRAAGTIALGTSG